MIIELKTLSSVAKIDTVGAELRSFEDGFGTEYIWQRNPDFWSKSSPILFPIVGKLKNNKTIINNNIYSIPKHGFAKDLEFKIIENRQNFLALELIYSNKTLNIFPFKFSLIISYFLEDDKISITYEVSNMDEKEMFYGIGAHPAFNCPLNKDKTIFENHVLQLGTTKKLLSPIYDNDKDILNLNNKKSFSINGKIKLDYNLFKDDAIIFENIPTDNVLLFDSISGQGVKVLFKGFEHLAFWTPNKKNSPFICIEPWSSLPHSSSDGKDFKDKFGINNLPSGEKDTYYLEIIPI